MRPKLEHSSHTAPQEHEFTLLFQLFPGVCHLQGLQSVAAMQTCTRSNCLLLNYTEYVVKYASKDAADDAGEESGSDDEMSSVGSYASGDDDEPAGNMEEL